MNSENSRVIVKDDECIVSAMHSIRTALNSVDEISKNYRPPLGGEQYLTDKELSQKLKVSRRTLQEYRTERIIPHLIFGGKTLYKETDIENLLSENYHNAIK